MLVVGSAYFRHFCSFLKLRLKVEHHLVPQIWPTPELWHGMAGSPTSETGSSTSTWPIDGTLAQGSTKAVVLYSVVRGWFCCLHLSWAVRRHARSRHSSNGYAGHWSAAAQTSSL